MDAVDNYFGFAAYTGFTIEINGNDYAVFESGGFYYVPYDPSFDDLSSLNGTSVTQPFTNAGDDAVVVNCFLAGTSIATVEGEVAVETLAIGDTVLNADGAEVAVKWIGRQTVKTMFKPAERVAPVRFAAGSLGEGLPVSDLTVTADHGMLVDGVICHAGALVNGTTITRVPMEEMGESYTVYHIETEAHEIILANGAPAETFIDNVSRRVFDNYAEFEALYGDVPEMEELPYPRAMSARQVPAHIARLLGVSKVA
ncbi:Hint domain-containing protein [Nioella sp.]|uniref:Hint domain-containing protein n=1 Tax=Nioella sp. TaxID=1912091 RepID=UPI003B515F7E